MRERKGQRRDYEFIIGLINLISKLSRVLPVPIWQYQLARKSQSSRATLHAKSMEIFEIGGSGDDINPTNGNVITLQCKLARVVWSCRVNTAGYISRKVAIIIYKTRPRLESES